MRATINPRARAALYHKQPPIEDKLRRLRRKRAHREAKAQARLIKAAAPDIRRARVSVALWALAVFALAVVALVSA